MKYLYRVLMIGGVVGLLMALVATPVVQAAELYSGDRLEMFGEEELKNAYVAGNWVKISQPVEQDLVVAGATVSLENSVSGGVLALANELSVTGPVTGNLRLAAGQATIDATVGQDLLMLAGQATITERAVIEGDVLFSGGSLTILGQVKGRVVTACDCAVTVNGPIGSFEGFRVDRLTFGDKAVVAGNVTYHSNNLAVVAPEAVIQGSLDSQPIYGGQSGQRSPFTSAVFYGLLTSLVFCLVLSQFLPRLVRTTIDRVEKNLLVSILSGLAVLLILPIVATLLLLPSVWLGLALWLLYLLLLLTAYFMGQLTLGWWLLQWWYGRSQQAYQVDWRAVVVGCLATAIVLMVPMAGAALIITFFIIALGGLGLNMMQLRK